MANAKKQPSGNWKTLVYDYTDKDNKRHYACFTAETKKESEYMAADFSLNKKRISKTDNLTLKEAIEKYIKESDNVLSPTTIAGYKTIQKFAFQDIINIPLKNLSTDILKSAVNTESKRPSMSTKGKGNLLSPKTICNEYGLITAVINLYNPKLDCTVKLPTKINNNINKELIDPMIIFEIVRDKEIELPVLLAMWLSFSISEIKGLTKSKSIKGDKITINEVVVKANNQEVRKKQAKQYARTRSHRIPQYIQSLIDKVDGDVLCPMSGQAVHHRFTRLLEQNNLPHMTFHDLRHENASVMAMLKVPDKYAMERGGWKTDTIMKKVYTQTFDDMRNTVDDLVDNFFESKMQTEMQTK